MDIKFRDLLERISTFQEVYIENKDTGEKFFPMYSDLQNFNDYNVIEISACKEDRMSIKISSED